MFNITQVWEELFKEQYEITVYLNKKLEKSKVYKAKKVLKSTPKHFIWIDADDQRHELKFVKPVIYHIVKIL
tara:strand:- start:188 stop:403 length:216 start_codon:yes stop_codon:yes gene_type:complete